MSHTVNPITLAVPVYIFDRDGTLSMTHHRQHLLDEKRWDEFFVAGGGDCARREIVYLLKHLCSATPRPTIYIFTGCGEIARGKYEEWLEREGITVGRDGMVREMKMRPIGFTGTDVDLKKEMLASLSEEERRSIVGVFEDRDSVVKMWRELGIMCLQVAYGDF